MIKFISCGISLFRYLIGGSVLYYPQLSSISSYQLYVEVSMHRLFPDLSRCV